MQLRARADRVWIGLILLALVSLIGFSLAGEPATYGGITFPHGDIAFADRVLGYLAASCVRDAYDDPIEALGPPDACGGCNGCHGCSTDAVALGFRLSELDLRGYLIVEFVDNVLSDVPGDDLFVYITNDKPCRVEISSDGGKFISVGETVGYPGRIDIAPYIGSGEEFRYVRLSDVPADEDHSECPGPSIDAVGAMGRAEVAREALGGLELQPVGELSTAVDWTPASILIILDASSSMSERIDGEMKIDIAKDVIYDLLANVPDNMIVGMRTFSGCGNSPVIAPIGPLDRAGLREEIAKIVPRSRTPIAYALEQAKDDFSRIAGKKLILLVTDGEETCGGDPVEAAEGLIAAGYDLRIQVVGFDIGQDSSTRDQLMKIAEVTGGLYLDASNKEELRRALSLSVPFSYTVYDQEGNAVYVGRLGDEGPKLPAGTYRVVIDTDPPIVLENVLISEEETTKITVERADGSYRAQVGG